MLWEGKKEKEGWWPGHERGVFFSPGPALIGAAPSIFAIFGVKAQL